MKNIPNPGQMRIAMMALAMSQETRDILDRLDIEEEKSVATLGRLLKAGAVDSDHMTRLIAKLEEAGAKPSRGVLEELAQVVRADPQGRAELAFHTD